MQLRRLKNLPLTNYFRCINVLQSGTKALSKLVLKNSSFYQNIIILNISDYRIWFKFCQHVRLKCESNNVWRDLSLSVSAFATVGLKISNCKFTPKIHFQIEHFMLPFLTLTLKVQSLII